MRAGREIPIVEHGAGRTGPARSPRRHRHRRLGEGRDDRSRNAIVARLARFGGDAPLSLGGSEREPRAWGEMMYVVSEGDPGRESFEEKLRALAREVSRSVERAAGRLDLDEIADRIGMGGERVKELAEFAGQWLNDQVLAPNARSSARAAQADPDGQDGGLRLAGPHPLDLPTEEQGLALSALQSGRWQVEPGTNELISDGEGPSPSERVGLVSELRARDWIAAGGGVTPLGRDALRRWRDSTNPS